VRGLFKPVSRLSPLGRAAVALLTLLAASQVIWSAHAVGMGIVTNVAGTGNSGFGGDGGPAVDAQLFQPRMITFDNHGNMYIADTFNQVIRKVDTNGIISTVAGVVAPVDAGTGDQCPGHYSGDDGPAVEAKLSCPHSVVVADDGRIVIADSANNRIREVDTNGTIRTIVGTGASSYSGDGGPANKAKLADPKGVILDAAGNLYIADTSNHRIRKVDASGIITTVVGTGVQGGGGDGGPALQAQLSEPRTLAWGPGGELYITEPKIHRIRKVDAQGIISLLAGTSVAGFSGDGGPAVDAQLNTPRGVAVDAAGVVYIADSLNNRVRRIGLDGIITTIGGTGRKTSTGDGGPATAATFFTPRGVAVWANDLYVADTYGDRIRMISGITAGPPFPTDPTATTTTSSTTTTTSPTTTSTTTRPTTTTSTTTTSTTTTSTTMPPPTTSTTTTSTMSTKVIVASGPGSGYWMLGAGGLTYPFGDAKSFGDASDRLPSSSTAVDIEPSPSGRGYWVLGSGGQVLGFGDATELGSVPPAKLEGGERAASLSATPSGRGYWVFTNRGRVLTFGDAPFLGDVSAVSLNGPVLDSVATPTGRGYYMVASDGGIFNFGDATFHGSMGGTKLNAPVRSLAPTLAGAGYWLVASDGGIFAFGDAPFRGSMGGVRLNQPVNGMVRFGNGYLMVASDGGIFNFSNRPFAGSLGATPPSRPIVSVAALPAPS
jgi:hypothetical protein